MKKIDPLVKLILLLSRFSFTTCIDINIESDRFIALVIHATNMNTTLSFLRDDEYIQAAPDTQLSSSQSNLLSTLLKEEDQYEYNQLLNIQLPNNIQQILHQVRLFFINYLYHIFHFLLYYVVMFISSSFIFCYMDGYHLTQKTNYSTTFTRSLHNSCFYHTLTQISRFIITIYRLSTTCSILSHQ
jgi:hypothetical protein